VISLDDSFLKGFDETATPAEEKKAEEVKLAQFKPPPQAAAVAEAVPVAPPPVEEKKVPPPQPPVAQTVPLARPAPAAPKPPPPTAAQAPEAKVEEPPPAKTKLKDRDLPPMTHAKVDVAFDENQHTTDKTLTDSYLSDRNSTAADHGPKNLKIGDPYIDNGQTNVIRYMGKRGEGNVAALDSAPTSGSVKKEGAPIIGDGGAPHAPDFSHSVNVQPPAAQPRVDEVKAAEVQRLARPKVAPVPLVPQPLATQVKKLEADPQTQEVGTRQAERKPVEAEPGPQTDVVVKPKPIPLPVLDDPVPARPIPPQQTISTAAARPAIKGAAEGANVDPNAELEKFAEELNGFKRTVAAGDGTTGTGPKMRKGEKGHEGDGSYRPGDDNAVSDVTTINLDSSATESGDPRFAKRFDAKTAYIKSFARHIDGKWKAELFARLRSRLVPGMVSIRVVLRKDGKLMEASESYRNRGIPDEYVATAKRAIEDAADPSADPFPPALSGRETIEYTFNFLYQ
jgi:hypothetical protein